jgi:hypothetical protein
MTLSVHAYWLWHWKISVNVTSKTINITDKSYNVSGWDQTCICGVMFSVLTSSVLDLSASRVKPKSRLNKNWYLLHLWIGQITLPNDIKQTQYSSQKYSVINHCDRVSLILVILIYLLFCLTYLFKR